MSDSEYPEPDGSVPSVSPAALAAELRRGEALTVLDVRDRDEYEAWHVDGDAVESAHVPYVRFVAAEVQGTVADLVPDLSQPITVVCGRGEASAYVAELLLDAGIEARNLAGGMDAWAEAYRRVDLDAEGPIDVYQYQRPSSGCLSYLLVAGGEAAVVDPLRAFADRYVDDCAELDVSLRYAVDTHVHADHVSGVRAVAERSDATPVVPAGADERGLSFDARRLADGEALALGDATVTALATPGHTTEMTSLRAGEVLLSGDTVFLDHVARPDLEAGADGATDLALSLHATLRETLATLPDETLVAPGHFEPGRAAPDDERYVARLGDLRARLPAFEADEAAFVEAVTTDLPPRPANYERIVATNLGREAVDDAAAFELELGPNNCAAGGADAD